METGPHLPEECFTCRAALAPNAPRYQLRIGVDLAPAFDAPAPEQSSSVEEETAFYLCARCWPAAERKVDELLEWLWQERPTTSPEHVEVTTVRAPDVPGLSATVGGGELHVVDTRAAAEPFTATLFGSKP